MERKLRVVRYITCIGILLLSIPSFAQITYSYGTYTGNGGATNAVTWVGFQPDVIFVKADNSSASYNAWIATSSMANGKAKSLTGTGVLVDNRMSATNTWRSNGFTVGSDVQANNNGTKYYFIAFKAGTHLKVGSVAGDNSGLAHVDHVTGFGFQPEMIWLLADDAAASSACALAMRSNTSVDSEFANGNHGNGLWVSAFRADGFSTGSWTNIGALTNHYIAFDFNNAATAEQTSYNTGGAPVDNTNISLASVTGTPDFVMLMNEANYGQNVFRTASMGASDASLFPVATALTANVIQSFGAGFFQVGTHATVNHANAASYHYAAMSGGNTLPVELLSFSAKKENDDVIIKWSTASEINNDFFTIERSTDGDHWEILKESKGAGNSSSLIEYSELDENPHNGISYYRLKQTDYDGQFKYSQTTSVGKLDGNLNITAFPNPVNTYMFVEFETKINSNIDASLYDQNGTRVKQVLKSYYDKGTYKVLVYTDDLPAGFYYIRLNTNTEGAATKVSIIH
jgi:hypothetical protein